MPDFTTHTTVSVPDFVINGMAWTVPEESVLPIVDLFLTTDTNDQESCDEQD